MSDSKTIPVTEDVLVIERKKVETGKVTVDKTVDTREAVVDAPVIHEEVRVERRRVDRPVGGEVPTVRVEGETTVIPVLEEVAVVEKRLVLREEVRITRVRREIPVSQSVALRREQVRVDRAPATAPSASAPSDESHPQGDRSMSQSVVAVFEDRTEAESARAEVVAAGIPSHCASVHANEGSSDSAMTTSPGTQIDTETGIGHFFRSLFGMEDDQPARYEEAARRGHATLVVDCRSEDEVDRVREILEDYDTIDIDERATQWDSERQGGAAATSRATSATGAMGGIGAAERSAADSGAQASIPVVEENLAVGKREVERGRVRVFTRVLERPVEESVQLREERARVERTPVDRPATEADMARAFKEGSMEIRERAEVPVVEKQARVVEEVKVGKDVRERTETVRDKVHKTDVRIEEEAPTAAEGDKPTRSGKPRK